MEKKYYEINEEYAERAKQSYSFQDYIKNSETDGYRKDIDNIYEIVENVTKNSKVDVNEKAYYLADMYARKYANWINRHNSNVASCPSIMIAGGSNFNVKKKEKQIAREDKIWKEYDAIQYIKKQIKELQYYEPKIVKPGVAKFQEELENEFFTVIQNEELNRIQLIFDGKPDEEIRTLLKQNAFKWSPKNSAWQRQLTINARNAVRIIIKKLKQQTEEIG